MKKLEEQAKAREEKKRLEEEKKKMEEKLKETQKKMEENKKKEPKEDKEEKTPQPKAKAPASAPSKNETASATPAKNSTKPEPSKNETKKGEKEDDDKSTDSKDKDSNSTEEAGDQPQDKNATKSATKTETVTVSRWKTFNKTEEIQNKKWAKERTRNLTLEGKRFPKNYSLPYEREQQSNYSYGTDKIYTQRLRQLPMTNLYTAALQVGTTNNGEKNTFSFLVDTGSSWNWVYSCNKDKHDFWKTHDCPFFDEHSSSLQTFPWP